MRWRPTIGIGWSGSSATLERIAHAFPVLSNDAHFDVVEGIERIAF